MLMACKWSFQVYTHLFSLFQLHIFENLTPEESKINLNFQERFSLSDWSDCSHLLGKNSAMCKLQTNSQLSILGVDHELSQNLLVTCISVINEKMKWVKYVNHLYYYHISSIYNLFDIRMGVFSLNTQW